MATIELFDRAFSAYPLPSQVVITPRRWSAAMPGGPDKATIDMTGPDSSLWEATRWLRFGVHIRNDLGALVWWGYVHSVTIPVGGVNIGLSLEGMHNRVKVLYSYDDADGAAQTGETDWIVTQAYVDIYGAKETRYSAGDCTPSAAEALANRILSAERRPVASARPGRRDPVATLDCRGWWHVLDWQYYYDLTGRIVDDTDNSEQSIGWALTSDAIGWSRTRQVSHNGNAFAGLRVGDQMRVTGSASNNITYWVKGTPGTKETTQTYTSNTVWFDASDDILNTANKDMGIFKTDDMILIAGSTNNSGYHILDSADAGHLVTDSGYGGAIVGEGSGPSITITRCLSAQLDTTGVVREMPGATTTLTLAGVSHAIRFTPSAGTFALGEVCIKVRKVGAPTDNLHVNIMDATGSGGLPGGYLGNGDLAAADMGTGLAWHTITLAAPVTVTGGTYYWATFSRSGSASATDYYSVGVDESFSGSLNVLKLWDGAAWTERTPNADGVIQLWGVRANETQMRDIAQTSSLIASADVTGATTGLLTRHYRDGSQTLQDELVKLLDTGTSGGGRLECTVTPLRTVVIKAEEAADANALLVDGDGLHTATGTMLDAGLVPAGKWATVRSLPHPESVSALQSMYLQWVEWDDTRGEWDWEPRGLPDVAALWTLRNG